MGGLIQTYRTGGALSGGGSGSGSGNTGVPLGPVNDWAGLAALSPAENSLAGVESLGTGNSNGIAIYDGAQWQLYSGIFDSVADMNAFAEPVMTGAVASVEETGDDNENGVRYQYDGAAWVRTSALSTGYAWAISGLFDFSPIGLQDGDFGIITAANGPIVVRYKAACPIAVGGTRGVWMTPIAYAGTPVLQMWTDGSESNATLAAQGWTVVNDAGCSVTATTGFQRLFGAVGAGTSARLRGMIGAVAAGTRVESIFEARASTPAASTIASPFTLLDGTNGDSFGQTSGTGVGFRDFLFGAPQQSPLRNGAAASMPALASAASMFVLRDEGRTVLTTAMQDGVTLGDYRRDLQMSAANLFQAAAQGAAGGAATLDYRGQVLTY